MDRGGKKLLSNVIRHAHSHNKVREERMMWEQRESELSREDICSGWSDRSTKRASLVSGHLVSDTGSCGERYDSVDSIPVHTDSDSHSSNYWTKQLMKAEENDPYRWGHGGYKEQNPEEFVSSEDEQAASSLPKTKKLKSKKRKRSKKDNSPSIPHKRQKQKHIVESSESDPKVKKHKKRQKQEKSKHRTKHKRKLRDSETETSSHSSVESNGKL